MAHLLNGKLIADEVMQTLTLRISKLKERGILPGLVVILVGEDPASEVYVRNKGIACDRLGIYSKTVRLPAETSQVELEQCIDQYNADDNIDGILVQLPLPGHLDENRILDRISPAKDVDGFHLLNVGKLCNGQKGIVSCTPKGILHMLKSQSIPLAGKHAVIVGRSNIVGKPIALLLLQENCTVSICHSKTENLAKLCKRADILVVAIGRAKFITQDMVKAGATVIDVGINRIDGKLCGDVDFDAVEEIAGYITPVPGGVGRMTIAMLMDNTVSIAEERK